MDDPELESDDESGVGVWKKTKEEGCMWRVGMERVRAAVDLQTLVMDDGSRRGWSKNDEEEGSKWERCSRVRRQRRIGF